MDCDFESLRYQTYDNLDAYRSAKLLSVISKQKPNEISKLDRFITYSSSSIILYLYYYGILNYK
ncbi:hypothetical protein CPAST_c31060 [Clostridium pasteurianum DSM 525 = ATCC 6013]|uniref:Uncharacterized protein n=2 Tax=Clostridium pasteurianum TaxID=1501 RepID=A0A0H3J7K5_CLOPA|nr:hypothetical protein [Clostridium pasteurianum]AJA49172.1 hypothetical protein CPAST_c31060 [Clostridium pasteurianum DSM 525 = ATCC 6013]AJA53160.1 hypothetical protein CLPA_c31060 [Clostridium pasteurianum DSM 525 = ATCC 6013]AOZ76355.1 hypothetical protein AQ983_15065 [Clostridium pasteurianum DSM 525 = ATCC 6013]AOZ80152.1 hypothetical protein AQ984_15060 [Clostridium pasteurianum]ELP59103.1 hypothetical protein F502_11476 [Clostridium pasteurianum DSM 525 = ATCC 6013]